MALQRIGRFIIWNYLYRNSGFIVHPNVGGALIVDEGGETAVNNSHLREFFNVNSNDYRLSSVIHHFYTLANTFEQDINEGAFSCR